MKKALFSWAACAVLCAVTDAAAFTFDDIHFWVGTGTNRTGVVIDWSTKHGDGAARAWGYRWNGTCTNLAEVVDRIVRADNRLSAVITPMGSWIDYFFFGYDVSDVAATFETAYPGSASDPAAFAATEASDYNPYWNLLVQHGSNTYMTDMEHVVSSPEAANVAIPSDGDWYTFRLDGWTVTGLAAPTAAESPYGYSVVSYATDATDPLYNDPSCALGEPARYMEGQWGGTVNPFNAAWGDGFLFSVIKDSDTEAHLTVAFDHDVMDDADNPYGIDFIVFGNSFCIGQSGDYYSDGVDIDSLYSTGNGTREPGLVEVSQDGETWFSFTDGPFADDAMPTLGYVYDKENPDASLFAGNAWFGRPTDATLPVDPSLNFEWCAGKTLGEICRAYNGSAGGTGFDLSKLDLPVNAAGQKWIRYVRIKPGYDEGIDDKGNPTYATPEVDAIADVAPVAGFNSDAPGWAASRDAALADAAFLGARILLVVGNGTGAETLTQAIAQNQSIRDQLGGDFVVWRNDGVTDAGAVAPYLSGVDAGEGPFAFVLDPWDMSAPVAATNGLTGVDDFTAFLGGVPEAAEHAPASTCLVTLDPCGGDLGTAPASLAAVIGGTVGPLPDPVLDERDFIGWFTAPEGGDEVTAAAAVSADVTIYAHWSGGQEPDPDPEPEPEPEPAFSAWTATKAQTLNGAVYDAAGNVAGVVQLKVAKPNAKKHTTKVSGSVTLLDGKKRSLKSATAAVPADAPIAANVSVKGLGTFAVQIGNNGFGGTLGAYTVRSTAVGGKWTNAGAAVQVAFAGGAALPAGTVESLLPDGVPVRVKGGKWAFDKAASVKYKKGALTVDTSRGRTNVSALKLTYTPKTGLFKGSFKLYAVQNGKLKKFTVKVTGAVVDGKGAGVAKLAKPAATWNVTVQ